jgi:cell wall-associated NlpC family hydrolase
MTAGTVAVAAPVAQADVSHQRAHVSHQIASAKHQLNHLQASAEDAAEKLNGARIELATAERKADAAKHDLARARSHVTALRKKVAAFASAAYTGQTMSGLQMVAGGSPKHWLDKMTTMDVIARQQAATMVALKGARLTQQRAEDTAQRALADQKQITHKLRDTRAELVANAHHQQQLLNRLVAKQQRIIERARQARERARQEAAERRAAKLKARREAAARAARQAAQMAVSAAPEPTTSLASTSSSAHSSHHSSSASSTVATPTHHSSGGGTSTPTAAPAPAPAGNAASVAVAWARRELGKPYQWGAAGPSAFDCSGLTMYVYGKAGVSLPHYTGAQFHSGPHVSRSALQPGDLVFFGSDLHHVGIYVGGGNMIEAPHTGANVRVSSINRSNYAGAVRPTA